MNPLHSIFLGLLMLISWSVGLFGDRSTRIWPATSIPQHAATTSTQSATTLATNNEYRSFPFVAPAGTSTLPCDLDFDHSFCRKDTEHVYSDGYLIVGADPHTFTLLGVDGDYGEDGNSVFWVIEGEEGPEPHLVQGANPQTFHVFSGDEQYAGDSRTIFWSGYAVAGADPTSFLVLPCGADQCTADAQDRHNLYLAGEAVK